eukprot:CAMPEP_0181344222 /NCGR_PEP_ID=MMETSP1101-20121128/32058_1 /TAXON_ID=46948 /ORGANISM="Rhodomonas abbreviata, Strain Caron Lab Isolate" /LENGTH=133 /DNA_ID=CAMNT_0023456011 /DNA_START=90 /DNA_END=491 /DNA_ORIENTATION=-
MVLNKDGEEIFQQKILKNNGKFIFDSTYPGTAPPGKVEENFPLKEVLELKINNLNVQEFSREQHCGVIRGADESILDWLQSKGKIKPRLNEDTKDDIVEKNQTLLEDEFDFEDGNDSLGNFFGHPDSNLSDFV